MIWSSQQISIRNSTRNVEFEQRNMDVMYQTFWMHFKDEFKFSFCFRPSIWIGRKQPFAIWMSPPCGFGITESTRMTHAYINKIFLLYFVDAIYRMCHLFFTFFKYFQNESAFDFKVNHECYLYDAVWKIYHKCNANPIQCFAWMGSICFLLVWHHSTSVFFLFTLD